MARPRTFDEAASASINIRVTPAQRSELVRVAQENRTDITGVVRQAVNEFVADYADRRQVFRATKSGGSRHNTR